MGLERVTAESFCSALEWAAAHRRKMIIRQIWYIPDEEGDVDVVPGQWYDLESRSGCLLWNDPSVSEIIMEQARSVRIDRTLRCRLDLLEGKADIKDGKGLYLQIKIEIPDSL